MTNWAFPGTGTAQVTLPLDDDGYVIGTEDAATASSEKNLNISNITVPEDEAATNLWFDTIRRLLYIFGVVPDDTRDTITINYTMKISGQDLEPAGN